MVNQQFATAVHILTVLAFHQNQRLRSDQIALSVNTNPVVIRRLLSLLTKAQLVETSRGKTGGVKLAKEPQQINLKDIYLSLSPMELLAPRTQSPHKECPVSCSMFDIMSDVSKGSLNATLKYLESKKLSDIMKKIPKK